MTTNLTEGFITALWRGEKKKNAIIQILNHQLNKAPKSRPSASDFYQLIVWDGTITTKYAVLAVRLNNLITSGRLPNYSIIRLDNYDCKETVLGKKVLAIYKLTILIEGNIVRKKISNVHITSIEDSSSHLIPAPVTSLIIGHSDYVVKPQENIKVIPIGGLITCRELIWFIKARLLQKGPIYPLSRDTKVFYMDLVDASGAIRAIVVDSACDMLHNKIELNEVFLITKCSVRPSKRRFTTIPHSHELLLHKKSVVMKCEKDDESMPKTRVSFTALNALKNIAVRSFVDIMGICISFSDLQPAEVEFESKKMKIIKREITLVDTSNAKCNIMLCERLAVNFKISNELVPIVSISGVGLFEMRGCKTVVASELSHLRFNPDLPEAHRLREWYNSLECNHEFNGVW